MDTATHIVMGITLGGLATIDPNIADYTAAQGVIIATVIGSQIPDIDTVLKLKNNAQYLRNHRGVTHSIPAIFIWSILISTIIHYFYPNITFNHLYFWTLLAIVIHVITDIFNAYGTQALRPFTNKWLALGVINTFDPIIFAIHAVGSIFIIVSPENASASIFFYVLTLFYYMLRMLHRKHLIAHVKKIIPHAEEIWASPSYRMRNYHIAIMTATHYYVAKSKKNQIHIVDTFERIPIPSHPLIEAAQKDDNIKAFLSFSKVYRWDISEYDTYDEVRFTDLRYRTKKNHYPFVAVIHFDKGKKVIESYTGWVFTEEKLQKKLSILEG